MRTTLLGLLLVAAGALPAVAQDDFQWTGRIDAGDEIEIKGVNGDIVAEYWSGSDVEVTAVFRARRSDPDDVEIEVLPRGGGVTICAVYPSRRRSRPNECAPGDEGRMNTNDNDVSVRFRVRVPAGVRFVGRTINGEIEASGLRSDVDAHTVNGDINVETTGRAVANTVNGSIWATMETGFTEDVEFETVNGSIVLDLPADLHADLHAGTVNGGIESDFPITVSGRISRRQVRGRIGGGGPVLAVTTVNGSVRLRQKR